ncbi:MAG TPA: hypothetical protein VMM38_04720 [Aridibacter sp.]|nr:hypothetical protein [Aridibacter sp.]
MLRTLTICVFILGLTVVAFAQDEPEPKGKVKAETQFSVKSLKTIDAETSQVGEDVNFVLTSDVQAEGMKLDEGAEFLARIVNIERFTDENKGSKISILFDFIQSGEKFMPCKALIVSIENGPPDLKVETSETFEGGTMLMMAGKNLKIPEGSIFRIKLIKDVEQ